MRPGPYEARAREKTRSPWGGRVGTMGWPRDVYDVGIRQAWTGLGGWPLVITFAEIAARACLLACCLICFVIPLVLYLQKLPEPSEIA